VSAPGEPGRWSGLWKAIASVGGIGYAPVASGTFGTVPGVLLWYYLSPSLGLLSWLGLCVALTAASSVAAHYAGPAFGKTDAGEIVLDEVAGVCWGLAFAPHSWAWAIAGFFAFRLFDITKPWPASYFDKRVKNGFGVTMDDVVAGWFTAALLAVAAALLEARG